MLLQNYLQKSRSLAKLESLGDIRESKVNECVVSKLFDLTSDSDSSADQVYSAALAALAPSIPIVSVQGGTLPNTSRLAGTKINDCQIGIYPVTMDEWQGVYKWALENGFDIASGTAGGPKHPVTMVNWYDCVKWCNAKSLMEGLDPVYSVTEQEGYYASGEFGSAGSDVVIWYAKSGYRLPTEVEWEWAARGGRKTQGYSFAGSNNLNAVGWYSENSGCAAHAVGGKMANELGLHDMSGNVWEWCWDLDSIYSTNRKHRGGGWDHWEEHCSVGYWEWTSSYPALRQSDIGFRIARSL